MNDTADRPMIYLKQHCPFCMKIWLYLLETNAIQEVEIREFATGSAEEEAIRAELAPHLEKVTFPAARLEAGRYIADSDGILSFLSERTGHDAASLPVLGRYVDGPFTTMMKLWKENHELKAAAAQA